MTRDLLFLLFLLTATGSSHAAVTVCGSGNCADCGGLGASPITTGCISEPDSFCQNPTAGSIAPFPYGGCTGCVVASITSTTCPLSPISGGTGGGSSGGGATIDFGNPVIKDVLQQFGGLSPTSGVGGLANGVGTTHLTGPEQGQASFTPHATFENSTWMKEAEDRRRALDERNREAKEGCRRIVSHGGPGNFLYPCGKAFSNGRWVPNDKPGYRPPQVPAPIGGLTGNGVSMATADYEERFLANGVVYTSLEDIPAGTPIEGDAGQPLGGIGVHPGLPDKAPTVTPSRDNAPKGTTRPDKSRPDKTTPDKTTQDTTPSGPTPPDMAPPAQPETPQTPQLQGRTTGKCRDSKWWFNSDTQMCYPTQSNCKAAGNDPKKVCTPSQ